MWAVRWSGVLEGREFVDTHLQAVEKVDQVRVVFWTSS